MSAQIWQNNHRLEGQLLLLEDHQELAASLEEFLELYSCRTVRVTSGADGLRKILLTDFDYILCDMVMPGFPGDMFYYAVERVKPALCRRFVFMSGEKGDPQWETFVAQVDGVMLWKPFHMHELLKALQAVSGKPLQRRPYSIAVPQPALGMPLGRRG